MDNPHGGFFFYTQHLVQVMMEIFGNYPETVRAWQKGETVHVDVHYADYDVDLSYVPGNVYYASVSAKTNVVGNNYTVGSYFPNEFMDFYRLLKGEPQKQLSKEFVREWLMSNGFQGQEGQQVPEMTDEIVTGISERYIELYEHITGETFVKENTEDIAARIEKNVTEWLTK